MAYMDQTKKAAIAGALKEVVPAGWKYSLSVRHNFAIVLTIKSAPVDLLEALGTDDGYCQVNTYHVVRNLMDRKQDALATHFDNILDALNLGNWDNSDIQTDYFDVGHYVDINVGRWDKPFVCTAVGEAA